MESHGRGCLEATVRKLRESNLRVFYEFIYKSYGTPKCLALGLKFGI